MAEISAENVTMQFFEYVRVLRMEGQKVEMMGLKAVLKGVR